MNLKLFPKHTGIWEGVYTRIDANGNKYDQWKSKLTIKLYDHNKYHQVNEYFWPDGHYELHDFGVCEFNENGELIFDNPRILGKSWETHDSVCLTWSYRNKPGSNLFEMIDLIGDGTHRIRTWKWSLGDVFQGNTMIEERRTATQEQIDPTFWTDLASRRFVGNSRSDH